MSGRSVPGWVADLIERHGEIDSLLVPAYIDLDESARVVPYPQAVFLGSADGFICLTIDEDTGQLHLDQCAQTFLPPELIEEPSVQATFVDLTENYLTGGRWSRITAVSFHLDGDSDPERGLFRGVALEFEAGEGVVLDPFAFSGIRLGTTPGLSLSLGGLPAAPSPLRYTRTPA
ncbi:hypothetical protein KIH74_27130 [Kineosporia sp. J2-2]|uniref:Uncharacterized protein n=1 Tax=Kineosporia corallincola TaxID=2835133 RepID=A0ABS5TNH8_9ACTN|nr:hypothetical protein [Kineosporia corallincola]MBT0772647.1 hypothetical protein [Kineosporia corallincola]